jgi:hypothetical protein
MKKIKQTNLKIEPMLENKWKRNCVVKKKFYTKLLVYKILHFDEFEFEFEFDLSNIPVLNALSKTCLTPSFESAEHSEILKKNKKNYQHNVLLQYLLHKILLPQWKLVFVLLPLVNLSSFDLPLNLFLFHKECICNFLQSLY